jgi:hypothetical protein
LTKEERGWKPTVRPAAQPMALSHDKFLLAAVQLLLEKEADVDAKGKYNLKKTRFLI